MRYLLILLAAILIIYGIAAVIAERVVHGHTLAWEAPNWEPPALEYHGPAHIVPMTAADVLRRCGDGHAWGCVVHGRGRCFIFVLAVGERSMLGGPVMDAQAFAQVVRHEKAHCAGWHHG